MDVSETGAVVMDRGRQYFGVDINNRHSIVDVVGRRIRLRVRHDKKPQHTNDVWSKGRL